MGQVRNELDWLARQVPVEVSIDGLFYAVYRLWDAKDECLYVGQSRQAHPLMRIAGHKNKSWWPEVARADYIEVPELDLLDEFEAQQIRYFRPKHNIVGRPPGPPRKHLPLKALPQTHRFPRYRGIAPGVQSRRGPVGARQDILMVLRDADRALTGPQIAAATGVAPGSVRVILCRMVKMGDVIRPARGSYRAAATGVSLPEAG